MDQESDSSEPFKFGAGVPAPGANEGKGDAREQLGAEARRSSARRRPAAVGPGARSALDRLSETVARTRREPTAAPRESTLFARLLKALGQCPGPSVSTLEAERALRRASADSGLARSDLYGYRPHFADSPVDVFARVAVAMDRRAGVLIILQPESDCRWRDGLQCLGHLAAHHGLEFIVDGHLDALRSLAGAADVALDVSLPIDFSSGQGDGLLRIREEATASAREGGADLLPEGEIDWFGAGIVEAPTPPLRILNAPGRDLYYGVRPPSDPPSPGDPDPLLLDADLDPMGAAESVAEAAFGEEVLGGYGSQAVSRAIIRADRFSVFTEGLLEVLEDGVGIPPLAPPAWATAPGGGTRELDPGLQAARRLGTDEGSTLIFESRRAGKRALVFTNVERRMRLGGGLKAPAILALLRG